MTTDAPKPGTDLADELARVFRESGGKFIGPKGEEALAGLHKLGRDQHRESRDLVTDALRRTLGEQLDRKADQLGAALDVLRQWAAETNPEALAEWLDCGGWESVKADRVEARLITAAQATAEAKAVPGIWSLFSGRPGGSLLLCYHRPRAEDPQNMQERDAILEAALEQFQATPVMHRGVVHAMGAAARALENLVRFSADPLAAPQDEKAEEERPPLKVLLGFDALRAGLQDHDWATLALMLEPANKAADWLGLLAAAWLKDRLPRAQREARAVAIDLRPKATTEAGYKWTPLPRALDIASALGGPLALDVNGESYAHEPSLAPDAVGRALRPRGMDIVPADWLGNPAQLSLALDLDAPPEALREYLVETAAKTARLAELPRMVPKLLGFMFAAAPMTGRPVKGTLLDLARWLYPDWSDGRGPTVKPWKDRRQGPRDLEAIGGAFVAVKSLRLVETKPDGTRHPFDLFTMDYDLSAKPDAQLGFMLNPFLAERMKGGRGGGFFLLNMTRWLALGIQNPRLFPLALRLAALWDGARVNNGSFDLERLRPIEADQLAYLCNTLPEGAAMYRTGRTKADAGRVALLNARANLEADLDALREAGLLGNWKPTMLKVHGKGWSLVPVPPDDYAEACRLALKSVNEARGKGRPKRG